MAERDLARILREIRRTAAEADPRVSDAQLLERFVTGRDEAAFELLVWRHRRLVFSVCWRVLSDFHDAEDAFQATFLALARKAGSIGQRQALAAWLYKVAYRAALTLRSRRARRVSREQSIVAGAHVAAPPGPPSRLERGELAAVVDEELSRLPQKFRVAAILCYLEGKTVDEAARQLGCPRGTLASRLARARERLRTRLARRGLALSAGAVTAALSEGGLSTAAPESLICSAIRTVNLYTAGQAAAGPGISFKVAALTEEVLRAMFFKKLASGAVVVVICASALLLGGALTLRMRAQAAAEPTPEVAVVDQPPVAGEATEKQPRKKELQLVVPPKPVTVNRPTQRVFTPYEDFTGRLEDGQYVQVRTRIGGRLKKISCQPGAQVKKGDLLFELDPTDSQVDLAMAKAHLDAAESKYKHAEAELQKAVKLLDKGDLARSALDKTAQEVSAAQAARNARLLDVERARLNLEATRVVAPTDGCVSSLHVAAGQLVAGSPKNPEVLATITSSKAIGLDFSMDEHSYLRYQRLLAAHQVTGLGSPLHVELADEHNFPHEGVLDRFEGRFNPATGTIRVHGLISNPDPLLLPGMFARIRMPFGKPRQVLEITEAAVFQKGSVGFVWVVNDHDILEQRQVKRGPMDGAMRVITEGLAPKDWVITSFPDNLHEGDKVERRRPPSPAQKQQQP